MNTIDKINKILPDLKKLIDDIDNLITYLQNTQFTTNESKDKDHRLFYYYNPVKNNTEITEIEFKHDEITKNLTELIVTRNEKTIKKNKKENNRSIKKKYYNNKQKNSLSLYTISNFDEIKRICEQYNREKEELNGFYDTFCDIIANKTPHDDLYSRGIYEIYEYFDKSNIITNRIKILNNNEIKTYFGQNIDYTHATIFSPPKYDFSCYSLFFHDNSVQLCNMYCVVKNISNKNYIFYGHSDMINPQLSINTEQKILNYLFDKHVLQNNNKIHPIIKKATLITKNLTIDFFYDVNLSMWYSHFYKMYLIKKNAKIQTIVPCVKITKDIKIDCTKRTIHTYTKDVFRGIRVTIETNKTSINDKLNVYISENFPLNLEILQTFQHPKYNICKILCYDKNQSKYLQVVEIYEFNFDVINNLILI